MASTSYASLSSATTLTSSPSTSSTLTPSKTFLITPSQETKTVLNIYASSSLSSSILPLYILTTAKSAPQLTLTLPTSSSRTRIGTATFHRYTNFNTDISLPSYHSKPITIHPSTTTYSHRLFHPTLGAMKWAPLEHEKGRAKDLHLVCLRDESVILATLEAPKEMGKEGSRLVMKTGKEDVKGMKGEVVGEEEVERFVVLSACAVGWRGHGKADVLGAAVGFGAVGI